MLRVSQQREWQAVLGLEFGMGLGSVGAHTQDSYARLGILAVVISEITCLGRTTRRIIFRIKIQNDWVATEV